MSLLRLVPLRGTRGTDWAWLRTDLEVGGEEGKQGGDKVAKLTAAWGAEVGKRDQAHKEPKEL